MPSQNGTTATAERDLGHMVERAREGFEDVTERAKKTLDTVDHTLQARMKENPLLVLGLAVGVGYVIGRVFSRIR